MVGEVCPRRLLTVASGIPRIMSQDAKVWRGGHGSENPLILKPRRLAQSHVSRHPTDDRQDRERPQGTSSRVRKPLKSPQSVSLQGKARAFPFLVCFSRIYPCVMSTQSQVRPKSSPFRIPVWRAVSTIGLSHSSQAWSNRSASASPERYRNRPSGS